MTISRRAVSFADGNVSSCPPSSRSPASDTRRVAAAAAREWRIPQRGRQSQEGFTLSDGRSAAPREPFPPIAPKRSRSRRKSRRRWRTALDGKRCAAPTAGRTPHAGWTMPRGGASTLRSWRVQRTNVAGKSSTRSPRCWTRPRLTKPWTAPAERNDPAQKLLSTANQLEFLSFQPKMVHNPGTFPFNQLRCAGVKALRV